MFGQVMTDFSATPNDSICDDDHIHAEQVAIAQRGMIDDNLAPNLAELFKILGDPGRIRIMSALDCAELCVYDIAEVVAMSQSAVSHQLRLLRTAGLVKSRKSGRHVMYSLDDEHVKQLFECGLEHIRHR